MGGLLRDVSSDSEGSGNTGGMNFGRSPWTTSPGQDGAVFPGGRGRGVGAGLGGPREIGQIRGGDARGEGARKLAQQVAVPGVAVLAVGFTDMPPIVHSSMMPQAAPDG